MGQSYRIRTEIGINKTINVQLDQDFDFIELLSLKLQQEDIYTRSCADYGVLAGRVTANNGFGIPNARISIFIPIENIDESDPIVQSIYPYKSPSDKNEDGYRYNLLPYEKSYSKHAATGTLPTRLDVLTGKTAIEIYDKYYKFTSKTNESGDYMIMGVPLGNQTVVMDVDLSDIGEFSLTPQDLIRMGLATEAQVAGNQFKSSNDLSSLPQLVTLSKSIDVSPLWGEPDICQISIGRVDFDLRDEANIDIQPTAVFMGSMFSAPDKFRVRSNCKPKDNLGNLCGLDAGPGQILAIRQTLEQDSDGNPVLEQYQLEQAGNVIDGSGVWLTEMPMNLEYVITNEFGEKVISYDPTIGIPTKGKYRFKIKWQQAATLTEQTRRGYFLVPNVREYGWTNSENDPNYNSNATVQNQLRSSYYFGLDWTGYTNGLQGAEINKKLDQIIDCQDTFYEFEFNKVYTVSGLIDQYKKGARGRFIGIKEIDDDACSTTVNKFPVNDGFRNFDLLFFIFSLLFQVVQIIGIPVLIVAHLILAIYTVVIGFLCALCRIKIPIINVRPFGFLCNLFNIKCEKRDFTIKLSMITYPDCEACECKDTNLNSNIIGGGTNGVLSYLSDSANYYNNLQSIITKEGWRAQEDISQQSLIYSQAIAGNSDNVSDVSLFKMPKSIVVRMNSVGKEEKPEDMMAYGTYLPLGENINLFNGRYNYFNGNNRISVTFQSDANSNFHYDNTITVLANAEFLSGQLLTTVDPATSTDANFLFTATTNNGVIQGLPGTTNTSPRTISVEYCDITNQLVNRSTSYKILSGGQISRQLYPMDREYFQVITAMTVSQASKIWKVGNLSFKPSYSTFPNLLESGMSIEMREKGANKFLSPDDRDGRDGDYYKFKDTFENFDQQYILILQRGVDPYSPIIKNKYGIGRIMGYPNENAVEITTNTRMNIPIQKLNSNNISVQSFSPPNIFYPSYFFTPSNAFSSFTTSTIGYYGALDSSYRPRGRWTNVSMFGATGIRTLNNRLGTNVASLYRYDQSDDLSGGSFMVGDWEYNREKYNQIAFTYYTPNLYPTFQKTPMSITNKSLNVMRTDRLPSSDQLNGQSWTTNPALLQQNNNFQFYTIPDLTPDSTNPGYSTGADQVQPELEDQAFSGTVYGSFSCPGMVSLGCYSGSGFNFGINENCRKTDPVERGCYILLKRPILDLIKDFKTFNEWGYRYRFFYGLCRGVLAQSFMNNWVNGTLFAFPIQTNTYFNSKNKPFSTFCKDLIYFDQTTNNFYYRSSPYNKNTNKFVGKKKPDNSSVNDLNLLFPTTIINLGPKDSFYQEITFNPSNKGYILNQLNPSSYNDTSDMVNLFVISRIVNSSFLSRLISIGDNGLDQLFSRDGNAGFRNARRIDGDLAQMMSINSEIGNISFSPEYYPFGSNTGTSPVYVDPSNKALIGIFFSSTTENLQLKDYISPGRIDFRGPVPNLQLYPFSYGIKSQVVPFYQWGAGKNSAQTIFGSEQSSWQTTSNDLVQGKLYQGLDRLALTTPSYFRGNNTFISDTFARGYIFEVSAIPTPNATQFQFSLKSGQFSNKFIVGAPFHFYFGLIKGETALDKFKTKYSISE